MCWNCSNTTEHHLQQWFPVKTGSSLQSSGWCEPANPADTLCVLFGCKNKLDLVSKHFSGQVEQCCSSSCRRCDGRRDKQPWLWISLVSSPLWACRCWFTGSDHTEVTERNRLSSLLFSLILLYCISLFSACLVDQMLEDTRVFPASANTLPHSTSTLL